MPEDELIDDGPGRPQPAVSRRQFLRGVGMAGAAGVLAPGLLDRDARPAEAERDDSHAPVQRGTIRLMLLVNGQKRAVSVEPRTTLLNALRNHMDPAVTGPKLVCDRGACGACTVEMDGKTVYACMTLAADAVGREDHDHRGAWPQTRQHLHPVQAAFVAHDALMCGFCTPGFIMSIRNYLDKNPRATLAQVQNACAGNTCRCGTYPRVFAAALDAARSDARRRGKGSVTHGRSHTRSDSHYGDGPAQAQDARAQSRQWHGADGRGRGG